jgi:hypothetical protein
MLRDNIQPYLPKLVSREMTNRAVARELNVTEHHLCRVLKSLGVKKEPAPDRSSAGKLLDARRELRTRLANDPELTLAQAASRANCSVRTIYRYKAKK